MRISLPLPARALPRLVRMVGAAELVVEISNELVLQDLRAATAEQLAQLAAYEADGALDELNTIYRSALASSCKACGRLLDDHNDGALAECYEASRGDED